MRIISGKYGKRRLSIKIPEGVRPTTDIVKESLFNILSNLIEFEGLETLDIFAGTGSLGFEALSRGASHVFFVDSGRKQIKCIEHAANLLKVPEEDYSLMQTDFKSFFRIKQKMDPDLKFNLVFADPPYALTIYDELLNLLVEHEAIEENCLVVLESDSFLNLQAPKGYTILDARRFGASAITLLQYQDQKD